MVDQKKIREGVRLLLEGIGEDSEREGLAETPDRIARMYGEIFSGLEEDAAVPLSSGNLCKKASDTGKDDGADRGCGDGASVA